MYVFGLDSIHYFSRFSAKTLENRFPAPNGKNSRRPMYKYVDIVEIPTDEMGGNNDVDNLTSIVNDANWPRPIPVNGPNSNLNTGGLLNTLKSITNNKWLDKKKSSYTKDFGSFIGRFSPRAHGISGLVSTYTKTNENILPQLNLV